MSAPGEAPIDLASLKQQLNDLMTHRDALLEQIQDIDRKRTDIAWLIYTAENPV